MHAITVKLMDMDRFVMPSQSLSIPFHPTTVTVPSNVSPNSIRHPSPICLTFIVVPSNVRHCSVRHLSSFNLMSVIILSTSIHLAPSIHQHLSVTIHPHQCTIFFKSYVLHTYEFNIVFFKPHIMLFIATKF